GDSKRRLTEIMSMQRWRPYKLGQVEDDAVHTDIHDQRLAWDALRRSINGLVNKVNSSNIRNIIPELFSENLVRGRGLFARACIKSQMAAPLFTHVLAALVAVLNTSFVEIGELVGKRVILQFTRALRRNDKPSLLAVAKFLAHLINQHVVHEVVALEVLMVLLDNPTDDSVEVSVTFVKECGHFLQDIAPQALHAVFERFRGILSHGENIDKRVQFMIEDLFAIHKSGFRSHPAVLPELHLVELDDHYTHEIHLSEELSAEMNLDVFEHDPKFEENEKKYEAIKKDILGHFSSDKEEEDEEEDEASEEDVDDNEDEALGFIEDLIQIDLVTLRRTIYLILMSSMDFEEAGHKLVSLYLKPGEETEIVTMLIECCCQERTYRRFYGLLGQRLCMINICYQKSFDQRFRMQYLMSHRLETNKLRIVAMFFAHLLGVDAISWTVLECIKLTEKDTTSSSRIFVKVLFQELSEILGIRKLNKKLQEAQIMGVCDGIFPKENHRNTKFAINFFTAIGLGGITDDLRVHLFKNRMES
ncbi:hypothetical protein GOP47_0029555, partial [Adiantum capillus-veneris]